MVCIMENINVAIDGPAGAGKSTIAKLLAKKLNFVYVDTGAMYRAITFKAINKQINLEQETDYTFLDETEIVLTPNGQVFMDGKDITKEIREQEVTRHVSLVASLKIVREKLVDLQRKMALKNHCIMDGRDIGTNVLPHAQVKLFLTASVEERARRRYVELVKQGKEVSYEEIFEDIKRRDHLDSTRELNPLTMAVDAIRVDTSNDTIDEVVNKLIEIILGRVNFNESNV
jgi:CMP/dCMP kinase